MAVVAAEVRARADATVKLLKRYGVVRGLYLFGSQVDGSADEWSDIDIAVFMDGVEKWDMHQRARLMTRVQREVALEVEVHLFPAAHLKHPPAGSFAAYILKHGVPIPLETRAD